VSLLRTAILMTLILASRTAIAGTYYIAANGSDSNSGTSETSPWLHAPGMPNCAGNCAGLQASLGGTGSNAAGLRIIFRGGDTWHFGNPQASPYTGGNWYWSWTGTSTSCVYEGTQTGCIYIGVDQTWYAGSSWTRPVLTADNPTSASLVSSCTYQISPGGNPYSNTFFGVTGFVGGLVLDNFEMTGLCQTNAALSNAYVLDSGGNGVLNNFWTNLYIHGWSATTATTQYSMAAFNMSTVGSDSFIANVVDGSDSYAPAIGVFSFPNILHMKDNVFRYVSQGVGGLCHDIHDNIFEHFYHPLDQSAHNNILECNSDANGASPNVFYNNIIRHNDPSQNGGVDVWFCPNTTPEYWFNNILYDLGPNTTSNVWDIAGPPGYSCSNTGGQYMFNNTFVDVNHPCGIPANSANGHFLVIYNEHLIGGSWSMGLCTGGPTSRTNVSMTDSTATSQGYTSGSSGVSGAPNQCANDTTPCAPTAAKNGTVGAGSNLFSYCATLASYLSDPSIGTDAAGACTYGTTDACAYSTSTHTLNCPGQIAVAKPSSGAWDAGSYQSSFNSGGQPNPPTNLAATAQ